MQLLVLKVYQPREIGDSRTDQFYSQLFCIQSVVNMHPNALVIAFEDFNVDFNGNDVIPKC